MANLHKFKTQLGSEEKLVQLLREYKNYFAWTYEEIPSLDRDVAEAE